MNGDGPNGDGPNGDGPNGDGPNADAPDAATDAPVPFVPSSYECDPSLPGVVKIRTASPNITLLTHDIFGSLVSRTTSGSTGIVDLNVPGCGSVTAIRSYYQTATYLRGGDDVWLEIPPGTQQPSQGPARLYIDSPLPGATSYWFLGPVAANLVTTDPTIRNLYWSSHGLTPQGLATIVVHGTDPQSGYPDIHNYSLLENVSLAAAIQSPLHVTSWNTQTATYQLRFQLPSPAMVNGASIAPWMNDQTYGWQGEHGATAQVTHDFDLEVSNYGYGLSVSAGFLNPAGQAIGQVRAYRAVIPIPSTPSITMDLTQDLLPELTGMSIVSSPSRPTFSWTTSATTTSIVPDITLFRTYGPVEWRAALPPGITSFQLPELPPDLARDFSGVTTDWGISLHEASDYTGYGEARERFVETFISGRMYPMGTVIRSSSIGSGSVGSSI